MSETLKLWFFRDLSDDQRLKLFGLFGLPVDEIGKVHGRQTIALSHIVRKLIDLVRDESVAPSPAPNALASGSDHMPRYTSKRLHDEIAKARAYGLEMAAQLIVANIVQDTSSGKVLSPRQDGNRDGLHYAVAIRKLTADVTDHGSKSDLHPEYVTSEDGTDHGYKSTLHPGNVPSGGDA